MYRDPGLDSTKIRAWHEGARMVIVGGPVPLDGYLWIQVVDPQGTLGWIPDVYLVSVRR
jgi:hypothetical protein